MSRAWDAELPTTEKFVLLALADWSNDEGHCWPSIAQLRAKCSLSERGVQNAVKALAEGGHITRHEVPGKGVNYTVHPRTTCTPAPRAPAQITTKTPAPRAPNTSVTTNVSEEAIASPDTARAKANPFPRPEWADKQVWSDFLANRKRKKASNTATAYKRLEDDIRRIADDEWPPPRLLEHAAAHGWAGIYDPRNREHGSRQPDTGKVRPSAALALFREGVAADEADRGHDWPSLSAGGGH